MIAIALLMLAQASGQTPPIEDYLPGGPERVHADALEWLRRAEAQLAEHEAIRVELEIIDSSGTRMESFWMRRGVGTQSIPIPDPFIPQPPYTIFQDSFSDRPLAGCLPLLAWFEAEAPAYSSLSLKETEEEGTVRLDWVRDGLRGSLTWSEDGVPLSWSWQGDGHWHRTTDLWQAHVVSWASVPLQSVDLPLRDAADPPVRGIALTSRAGSPPMQHESAVAAWTYLARPFSLARGIGFSGTLYFELPTEDGSSIPVGEVRFSATLYWPALGLVELEGNIGLPGKEKPVQTMIIGDQASYWHWDRLEDEIKGVPGLPDLLAGFQGMLPLYAWAARGLPEEGIEVGWLSPDSEQRWLRVSDGPTTTDFLVERGTMIRQARVMARDAGPGSPVLRYEFQGIGSFHGSLSLGIPARKKLQEEIALLDEFHVRLAEYANTNKAPLSSEELLTRGARAPARPTWIHRGVTESVAELRGKPAVLVLWYRDAVSCLPALASVEHLARGKESVHFRAIVIDEREERAEAFLQENRITLPLGVADGTDLQRAFRARWLPTTYLIGADGIVLGAWLGDPGAELARALEKLPQ